MSVDIHRRAEAVMARAERLEAEADGHTEQARPLYLEAAALEGEVLKEIPASRPRTRGIIAVSTASLYWRAGAKEEVARIARRYLACPDLPEFARAQLGDLLANRDPMLRRLAIEETSEQETPASAGSS
jgi:hypothetical protein